MGKVEPPYIGLAPYGCAWAPSIFFTRNRDREEFLGLADWLCGQFGADVIERYGGSGEDDKEYWTLRVAGSDWLLMRCFYPTGISLSGQCAGDLPAFEEIARAIGARPIGWRYHWLRLRRRVRAGREMRLAP